MKVNGKDTHQTDGSLGNTGEEGKKGIMEDDKCMSTLFLTFYYFYLKDPGSKYSVKLFTVHFW